MFKSLLSVFYSFFSSVTFRSVFDWVSTGVFFSISFLVGSFLFMCVLLGYLLFNVQVLTDHSCFWTLFMKVLLMHLLLLIYVLVFIFKFKEVKSLGNISKFVVFYLVGDLMCEILFFVGCLTGMKMFCSFLFVSKVGLFPFMGYCFLFEGLSFKTISCSVAVFVFILGNKLLSFYISMSLGVSFDFVCFFVFCSLVFLSLGKDVGKISVFFCSIIILDGVISSLFFLLCGDFFVVIFYLFFGFIIQVKASEILSKENKNCGFLVWLCLSLLSGNAFGLAVWAKLFMLPSVFFYGIFLFWFLLSVVISYLSIFFCFILPVVEGEGKWDYFKVFFGLYVFCYFVIQVSYFLSTGSTLGFGNSKDFVVFKYGMCSISRYELYLMFLVGMFYSMVLSVFESKKGKDLFIFFIIVSCCLFGIYFCWEESVNVTIWGISVFICVCVFFGGVLSFLHYSPKGYLSFVILFCTTLLEIVGGAMEDFVGGGSNIKESIVFEETDLSNVNKYWECLEGEGPSKLWHMSNEGVLMKDECGSFSYTDGFGGVFVFSEDGVLFKELGVVFVSNFEDDKLFGVEEDSGFFNGFGKLFCEDLLPHIILMCVFMFLNSGDGEGFFSDFVSNPFNGGDDGGGVGILEDGLKEAGSILKEMGKVLTDITVSGSDLGLDSTNLVSELVSTTMEGNNPQGQTDVPVPSMVEEGKTEEGQVSQTDINPTPTVVEEGSVEGQVSQTDINPTPSMVKEGGAGGQGNPEVEETPIASSEPIQTSLEGIADMYESPLHASDYPIPVEPIVSDSSTESENQSELKDLKEEVESTLKLLKESNDLIEESKKALAEKSNGSGNAPGEEQKTGGANKKDSSSSVKEAASSSATQAQQEPYVSESAPAAPSGMLFNLEYALRWGANYSDVPAVFYPAELAYQESPAFQYFYSSEGEEWINSSTDEYVASMSNEYILPTMARGLNLSTLSSLTTSYVTSSIIIFMGLDGYVYAMYYEDFVSEWNSNTPGFSDWVCSKVGGKMPMTLNYVATPLNNPYPKPKKKK